MNIFRDKYIFAIKFINHIPIIYLHKYTPAYFLIFILGLPLVTVDYFYVGLIVLLINLLCLIYSDLQVPGMQAKRFYHGFRRRLLELSTLIGVTISIKLTYILINSFGSLGIKLTLIYIVLGLLFILPFGIQLIIRKQSMTLL